MTAEVEPEFNPLHSVFQHVGIASWITFYISVPFWLVSGTETIGYGAPLSLLASFGLFVAAERLEGRSALRLDGPSRKSPSEVSSILLILVLVTAWTTPMIIFGFAARFFYVAGWPWPLYSIFGLWALLMPICGARELYRHWKYEKFALGPEEIPT